MYNCVNGQFSTKSGTWSPYALVNFAWIDPLDIAFGMVFDAMHCFDMGVFKQLGSLWFDSSFHDKPWYIGTPKIIAAIDLALLEIIPPSNIVRIAQSLNQEALWKSSEWRSFFVFYAPYILKYLMKAKYYS